MKKKSYELNGFTKKEALDKIQNIYKTEIQANAIESSGLFISNALYAMRNNK